jgi:hypothetical protein
MDKLDLSEIEEARFFVARDTGDSDEIVQVPVAAPVAKALIEMLGATRNAWRAMENPWEQFELAEKYGSAEKLRVPLEAKEWSRVRSIYSLENAGVGASVLSSPEDIIYYCAAFRTKRKEKIVAVRRATQMKGLLRARNRLIRVIDNTLMLLDEVVFRLDNEFDFVITADSVSVLHPSAFEYVADVEAFTQSKAKARALALGKRLKVVDFRSIAQFAETHRRAARLIAALSTGDDLGKISKKKLKSLAARTQVALLEAPGGKLQPDRGSELALLELLDYRRYDVDLSDTDPLALKALSRSRL